MSIIKVWGEVFLYILSLTSDKSKCTQNFVPTLYINIGSPVGSGVGVWRGFCGHYHYSQHTHLLVAVWLLCLYVWILFKFSCTCIIIQDYISIIDALSNTIRETCELETLVQILILEC